MALSLTLHAETPADLATWQPTLHAFLAAVHVTALGAAPKPVEQVAAKPAAAPAKLEPAKPTHPGPFLPSGRTADIADMKELVEVLKARELGPILKGLTISDMRELFVADAKGDEQTVAKFRARAAAAAEPGGDPPAKAPPQPAKATQAAPAKIPQPPSAPAAKAQPAQAAQQKVAPAAKATAAPAAKKKPAPPQEDEQVDEAPQVAQRAPVPAKSAKSAVVDRAPIPGRGGVEKTTSAATPVAARAPLPNKAKGQASPNVLGRQTPDAIPGDSLEAEEEEVEVTEDEAYEGDVEDVGEDDAPEEGAEDELEEVEGDVEVEEEVYEEADTNIDLPTVDPKKIPAGIKSVERLRDVIAAIQRQHVTKNAVEVYNWMLAYRPFVPKIDAHLESEQSQEAMLNRIQNILNVARPAGK